jgi:hypothetical protein
MIGTHTIQAVHQKSGFTRTTLALLLGIIPLVAGMTKAIPTNTVTAIDTDTATDPLGLPPAPLRPFFQPPADVQLTPESYRSPLLFDDGRPVRTPQEWTLRRQQIHRFWSQLLGNTPPLLERPRVELLSQQRKNGYVQHHIRIETAPRHSSDDAYLLVPNGDGPFPAVVVVFYDGKTGIGEGKKPHRDFARMLAQRGFVTLSFGSTPYFYYPTPEQCRLQPLAFHAYEAANIYRALCQFHYVDAQRVGIIGHSYGGKWAMFACCLYDVFAAAVWSDPGIVFDETRPNVNYWDPWYLGWEPGQKEQRPRGLPSPDNPRRGPYKLLIEHKRDLHELHALMAPRPFLVSGGSEDPPTRWSALYHSVAVNRLLGYRYRVAMTHRPGHDPTAESNEQVVLFFQWALQAATSRQK